ncbi:heme-binding domain-containing protein [Weeksellaceae bacterium TAE3-ERU29]|nr:heme-binding domain-containing protein [Weeksellaceae bacterium TAE3-ERU29]
MKKKKIILIVILIAIAIQFVPVKFENPAVLEEQSFFSLNEATPEVKSLIYSACYDCHSNEVNFPSYTKIAPVNFWIKRHIDRGREDLNFSEWGKYVLNGKANHKLEECVEKIEKGKMPLKSYTWMHEDAKLTEQQKQLLIDYFNSLINR